MKLNKRLCHVAYDGTDYHGFSISIGKNTVQQTIENTLAKIFGDKKIPNQIEYTSRTDKGVHAYDQIITFFAPHYFESNKLLFILNQRLPYDVRIQSVSDIPEDFKLRDQIKAKIYHYSICQDLNDPFISRYVWTLRKLPELDKLNQFLQLMIGEQDFSLLAKESYRYASTICKIYRIACNYKQKEKIDIEIEGNRFLYNMIRRMIGFTVFLSLNQKTCPQTFEEMISIYLHQTNMLAPASGLTLKKVILTSDS